ncbi:hypothetical protein LINPERPRIM_LOCUS18364 [Linum perenne]
MFIIPTKSSIIIIPKPHLLPLHNQRNQRQQCRRQLPNPMAEKPLLKLIISLFVKTQPPPQSLHPHWLNQRTSNPSIKLPNRTISPPRMATRDAEWTHVSHVQSRGAEPVRDSVRFRVENVDSWTERDVLACCV